MNILNEILRQSLLNFLLVGSIVGLLLGAGMIFKQQQVMRLNQYFSRWIGSEKLRVAMDRPRWIERFMYRHHRLVGTGVFVGALTVLYVFLFRYNFRTISAYIPRGYWWLSDALTAMLLVGSVLAALVGIMVLTRPSLLKEIEKAANRWVSTERLPTVLNSMHSSAEQSMLRHHRIAGVSIMLGSLYVLVILGYALFRGGGKLWG